MALPFLPFGFRPVRNLSGSAGIATASYSIASGAATTIRKGDPVKLAGNGTNIVAAAAGDVICGIFNGCWFTDAYGQFWFRQQFLTGTASLDGSDIECLIWDDLKNIVWEVQTDTFPKTDAQLLFDFNAGTGNSMYQMSGAYLDHAAGGATTDKAFRVLRLAQIQGNEWGTGAVVEVTAAEGTSLNVIAGVGGVS